jgi:hypothetical protein
MDIPIGGVSPHKSFKGVSNECDNAKLTNVQENIRKKIFRTLEWLEI